MYSFESKIRYSETGSDRHLTVPALLNYFQDCSTAQSEDLGIGLDYLEPQGQAWVLNFWQCDITRLPVLGETVVVATRPYEFKGVMGSRNYEMRDQDGNRLAVANTLYTLMNMEKHVPVKPDDKMKQAYQIGEKMVMDYVSRKIRFPEGGQALEPITIQQHHLDTNDHVNNVQYVSMAQDLIPKDLRIGRVLASYHISAVEGDVIYPYLFELPADSSVGSQAAATLGTRADSFYKEQKTPEAGQPLVFTKKIGVDLRREDGESFCKVLFCG
ncbi:MAG: acyl-[Lachnospiraceae bacterium]|nr:acyl-[acyl-carrier-protein] thioesterase [Lachnospiraceae bacterium]